MNHNKTLHLEDYAELSDFTQLFNALEKRLPANVDHPHRRWEYGLALSLLLERGVQRVLEIGSGGSLFAPMATLCGLEVTCVDPSERVHWAARQAHQIEHPIAYHQTDLDHYQAAQPVEAVVCLSTIEHVPEDRRFFELALSHARQLAIFTTDFSMDGGRYSADHLRTYTPQQLALLAQGHAGWQLTDMPAWTDNGCPIFGTYNFASVCLCTI